MDDTQDPKAWLRRQWSMDPREALYQKRLHGPNVVLPPDFSGLRLEDLERLVAEIERPRVEAEAAARSARRIAEARSPWRVRAAVEGTIRQMSQGARQTESQATAGK